MKKINEPKIPLPILKGIFLFGMIAILIVIPLTLNVSKDLWFVLPALIAFLYLFIFSFIHSKEINEKNLVIENKLYIFSIFCWIVAVITLLAGFFIHKLKDPILLFGWIIIYSFMIISSILKIRENKRNLKI